MADSETRNESAMSEDMQLDTSQLKRISGGASGKKEPEEVWCATCHVKMDYVRNLPNSYEVEYRCPKCGFSGTIWTYHE